MPEIEMIPPARGMNKDARIRQRFGYMLGRFKVYIRRGQIVPRVECRHFPSGKKDWLDTFAQAMEKFGALMGIDKQAENNARMRKQRRQSRAKRSGVTGSW